MLVARRGTCTWANASLRGEARFFPCYLFWLLELYWWKTIWNHGWFFNMFFEENLAEGTNGELRILETGWSRVEGQLLKHRDPDRADFTACFQHHGGQAVLLLEMGGTVQQNCVKEPAPQMDLGAKQWPYACTFRGWKTSMHVFSDWDNERSETWRQEIFLRKR